MKYYAVTDDPNELLHYGRLGMKWGQHIFVGPKSLAYKRAEGKLRKSSFGKTSRAKTAVSKVKNAISQSRAQRDINRQKKQEAKYNKAVQKAQRRLAITENLNRFDNLKKYEKGVDREYKNAVFAEKTAEKRSKIANRMERKYAKNERKMEKYMQEAREGRLKYGQLSDDQIERVRNRLALENTARVMGGREKAKFRTRLKEATQEGILQGVVQGTAAGMKEIAVAKVQNRLKNKRALDKENRNEAQRQKEATRIKNKKTRKEIREDAKQEAYEAQVESGMGILAKSRVLHPFANNNAGKMLQKAEAYKKLSTQNQEYKLLYDKNGELTKLGKKAQKVEDANIDREAHRNLKKFNAEEELREQKRIADVEAKRRNDIDEKWENYINDGGETNVWFEGRAPINIGKGSPLKGKELYEKRAQALAKDNSEKEKAAYEKYVKEATQAEEKQKRKEAAEALEKKYERECAKIEADDKKYNEGLKTQYEKEVKAVEEYNNNVRERYQSRLAASRYNPDIAVTPPTYRNKPKPPTYRQTAKPDHDSYVNDKAINKELEKDYYARTVFPTYERAKVYSQLGLPSPLQKDKNNQGKKNKGGK